MIHGITCIFYKYKLPPLLFWGLKRKAMQKILNSHQIPILNYFSFFYISWSWFFHISSSTNQLGFFLTSVKFNKKFQLITSGISTRLRLLRLLLEQYIISRSIGQLKLCINYHICLPSMINQRLLLFL